MHCHNELDARSAIAAARAVESVNPLFLEDPLAVPFSEAWMAIKRSTRIPILTGEKLELRARLPSISRRAGRLTSFTRIWPSPAGSPAPRRSPTTRR